MSLPEFKVSKGNRLSLMISNLYLPSTTIQFVQVSDNICNMHKIFTPIHNIQRLQMLLSRKAKELPAALSYKTMKRLANLLHEKTALLEKLVISKFLKKFQRI
jgi:hypothetical protein